VHRCGRNFNVLHTKINYENKKFPVACAVSNNIFCSMPLSLAERTLHIRNTPYIGNQYVKGGSRATRNALAVPQPPSYGPTAILQSAIYDDQVVQLTDSNVADQGMSVSQRSRIT
jgi:hypothetical protein